MLSAEEISIIFLIIKVAAASVLFSLPPALAAALLLARTRFPGKTFVDALIHLPLALAAGIMGSPLMVRATRLALEAIVPRLEAAARTRERSWPKYQPARASSTGRRLPMEPRRQSRR